MPGDRLLSEKQRNLIEQFASERGERAIHTSSGLNQDSNHLDDRADSSSDSGSAPSSHSFLGKLKNLIHDKQTSKDDASEKKKSK